MIFRVSVDVDVEAPDEEAAKLAVRLVLDASPPELVREFEIEDVACVGCLEAKAKYAPSATCKEHDTDA